ncbi:MAG: ABC transporter substrate-binding protein [Nitrososphaerota archaeon]|nr:ABC transporter substrate-binding protein [Nitrososphaerota archaeon]
MRPQILGIRNRLTISLAFFLICIVVAAVIVGVAGYYIGHSGGYRSGYDAGYSEGYNRGRSEGLAAGAERAYREGYTVGYGIGYRYGFSNGTFNIAKALYMGLKDRIIREIVQVSAPNLPSKIKVGCLMALTGELGPMGVEIAKGAQLAVALVNRLGGVAGRPVELILEDTATDPSRALMACKKLVEVDGVKVIVGPMASGEVMAIGGYVNERKVVLVSPSATSPYITLNFPDDYVFRVVGSDTAQAKALVKLALDAGCKKIATLVIDNPYGVGIEDVVSSLLGAKLVLKVRYDPRKMDFRTELTQIKGAGVDGVIYVGYYEDGRVMFRQAFELGLDNVKWFAAEGVYGDPMLVVPESAEFMYRAVVGTRPLPPLVSFYDEFLEEYEAVFGAKPAAPYIEYCLDATLMLLEAIAKAGVYDGVAIKQKLMEISSSFLGASGYKAFDNVGDQLMQIYSAWKVVKEGGVYRLVDVEVVTP